jgi:quinol---cytochrome-c reductase cytochrome c subunit
MRQDCRRAAGIACLGAWIGALSLTGHGQTRTIADRVYSDAQATRGQQLYEKQCVSCHGTALEGIVGPPLAGDGFLSVWSGRSLANLVDKIEQTMPPQQSGSLSRPQAIDLAAFVLRTGKYAAGPSELTPAVLGQIAFPRRRRLRWAGHRSRPPATWRS